MQVETGLLAGNGNYQYQIITYNLTSGTGNYTITNNSVYSDETSGNMTSGGKYDVKIIVYPLKALILDTVVDVR